MNDCVDIYIGGKINEKEWPKADKLLTLSRLAKLTLLLIKSTWRSVKYCLTLSSFSSAAKWNYLTRYGSWACRLLHICFLWLFYGCFKKAVLRIRDLGSNNSNKRKGKKFPIFLCHKFHTIKICYIFEQVQKKKFEPIPKNFIPFTQKLSLSSQLYGFGTQDP
jgi:hypothetical protein